MRLTTGLASLLFLTGGCGAAQNCPPPPATNPVIEVTDNQNVDPVLDRLDRVGQGLKDFTADVTLTETDPGTGQYTVRKGKVWFQNKPDGDARIRVTFDTKESGEKIFDEKIEYLLDDGWLVDRDYRMKTEVKRQVRRPGEKMNLLKLGEGPFPLPIGQKKEEVHRLFEVQLIPLKENDPVGTTHLQLIPKAGTQFERKFASLDAWVDQKTDMPARIETLDPNQTSVTTTDLENIRINTGLGGEAFNLAAVEGWTEHQEPFED